MNTPIGVFRPVLLEENCSTVMEEDFFALLLQSALENCLEDRVRAFCEAGGEFRGAVISNPAGTQKAVAEATQTLERQVTGRAPVRSMEIIVSITDATVREWLRQENMPVLERRVWFHNCLEMGGFEGTLTVPIGGCVGTLRVFVKATPTPRPERARAILGSDRNLMISEVDPNTSTIVGAATVEEALAIARA